MDFALFCPQTSTSQDKQPHTWSLKVTPVDYLLGVADLTGELMRLCISSVGNGDIDTPFELSQFLRQIYDGLLSLATLDLMKYLRNCTL